MGPFLYVHSERDSNSTGTVGISLKELVVSRCRIVWSFAQGLKFKTNLHSKFESLYRRELGSNPLPNLPPGNSKTVYRKCIFDIDLALCYMLSRAKKYMSEFLDFTCICIG